MLLAALGSYSSIPIKGLHISISNSSILSSPTSLAASAEFNAPLTVILENSTFRNTSQVIDITSSYSYYYPSFNLTLNAQRIYVDDFSAFLSYFYGYVQNASVSIESSNFYRGSRMFFLQPSNSLILQSEVNFSNSKAEDVSMFLDGVTFTTNPFSFSFLNSTITVENTSFKGMKAFSHAFKSAPTSPRQIISLNFSLRNVSFYSQHSGITIDSAGVYNNTTFTTASFESFLYEPYALPASFSHSINRTVYLGNGIIAVNDTAEVWANTTGKLIFGVPFCFSSVLKMLPNYTESHTDVNSLGSVLTLPRTCSYDAVLGSQAIIYNVSDFIDG